MLALVKGEALAPGSNERGGYDWCRGEEGSIKIKNRPTRNEFVSSKVSMNRIIRDQ